VVGQPDIQKTSFEEITDDLLQADFWDNFTLSGGNYAFRDETASRPV
jgi:hypothetical protein